MVGEPEHLSVCCRKSFLFAFVKASICSQIWQRLVLFAGASNSLAPQSASTLHNSCEVASHVWNDMILVLRDKEVLKAEELPTKEEEA